jgi:hypothetical protein
MATLGNTNSETTQQSFAADTLYCVSSGVAGSNGAVTDIKLLLGIWQTDYNIKVAIYSGATPTTKVGTEASALIGNMTGSAVWTSIPYTANLVSGTTYWICFVVETGFGLTIMRNAAGNIYTVGQVYANSFASSISPTIKSDWGIHSAYTDYDPASSSNIPAVMLNMLNGEN